MLSLEFDGVKDKLMQNYIDLCEKLGDRCLDPKAMTIKEAKTWALLYGQTKLSFSQFYKLPYKYSNGEVSIVPEEYVLSIALNEAVKGHWKALSVHLQKDGFDLLQNSQPAIGIALCTIGTAIRV